MGNFLGNLEVPTITHLTANSTTPVVSSSIASSLMTQYGTGSGPFGAPMIVDYLGSVAGMPYASVMTTINSDYATVSNSINLTSLLTALDSAVTTYVYSYSPLLYPSAYPSTTALTTAVNNINSALNSLSTNSTNKSAQGLYYKAVNQLSTEVSNLSKAGVVFNSGFNSAQLQTFAMNIGTTATDKHQYQTYQFFANLITNDSYGETVKLVVAESLNQNILGMKGISTTNDPQTAQAVRNAASQNVSLTTYLSHNK
jgi:hypothetical protein